MRLVTKYSDEFLTDKVRSLIKMDEAGINIPRTVLINNRDIVNIDTFIEYSNSLSSSLIYPRYGVRLSFSDISYPHYIQAIVEKNNIETTIKKLINKAHESNIILYDIILQPLLENIMWSGGILKKDDFTFVELVYGTGKMIFREGQYIYRYLHTDDYEFEIIGNQSVCTNWFNGDLIRKSLNSNDISQDLLRDIASSIQHVELINNKLYEFGIVNNKIVFLESKTMINGSYDNLDKIFTEEEYSIVNGEENHNNILVLDEPLFNHINKLNSNSSVYVNSGSILSHLAFYCTQKQIPCKFKTSYVNKYSSDSEAV